MKHPLRLLRQAEHECSKLCQLLAYLVKSGCRRASSSWLRGMRAGGCECRGRECGHLDKQQRTCADQSSNWTSVRVDVTVESVLVGVVQGAAAGGQGAGAGRGNGERGPQHGCPHPDGAASGSAGGWPRGSPPHSAGHRPPVCRLPPTRHRTRTVLLFMI